MVALILYCLNKKTKTKKEVKELAFFVWFSSEKKGKELTVLFLFSVQITDRIRYRLLGYRPADLYFRVNAETGVVSLTGDLTADSAQTQTYTVRFKKKPARPSDPSG